MNSKKFWQTNWVGLTIIAVAIVAIFMAYQWDSRITTAVAAAALRQAIPLILGALCGLLCERSGVVNIGIEGTMLITAFTSFMANVYLGNLWLALLVGLLTGVGMGGFLSFMSVTLKMDQIIGGTVLNIMAIGLTGYFYQQGLTTQGKIQLMPLGSLAEIPFIGPVLFSNPPITYAALILVFVVHYLLFYTRWGLRTRAVGEHPRAADTVGINVYWMRYANVMLGSCLAGLAGAYLALEAVGSFERGMTNGRGFIALAVMLFGKRTPLGALGAALLFGLASAMQTQLQFIGINVPHQFVGMLPYLLTILVLAGFVGRTRDPKALGQPYEK
jgi:general nucleoside transport system permease protein